MMRWIALAGVLFVAGCQAEGDTPIQGDAAPNDASTGPTDADQRPGLPGAGGRDAQERSDARAPIDDSAPTDAGMSTDAGPTSDTSAPVDAGRAPGQPSDAGDRVDTAIAHNEAGPPRSFLLASTGARLDTVDGLQLTPADLATDVDVIAIHQDFYGIPWDEFATDADPPALWIAKMDALAKSARELGKPVFLSLAVLAGTRDAPAEQVAVRGDTLGKAAKGSRCQVFDETMRRAYANYVTWMESRFEPQWINIAIEINGYQVCPELAWRSLVEVANAAYDAAKAARPAVLAFPSFQIDQLYGTDPKRCGDAGADACFEANYAAIAGLRRDRFAVSSYPFMVDALKGRELPSDWFTRAAERRNETTVIAETGWNSESLVARLGPSCLTAITSSEDRELDYLERVVSDAESRGIELVTWWSNRDVIQARVMTECPCSFDASWCAIVDAFRATGTDDTSQFYGEAMLKLFGTMGVRGYDGAPKAKVYPFWQSTLARACAPSRSG